MSACCVIGSKQQFFPPACSMSGAFESPLDEVLVMVLVGLLCRAGDFDEIEDVCAEFLDWLRRFSPFENGIAPAQPLRRTMARLDPRALEEAFASWTASRIPKDHSARNLALIRRAVVNFLQGEPSALSLKRKRLKAAISPDFRAALLAR